MSAEPLDATNIGAVVLRLEKLERQNHRLKRAGLAGLLIAAALLAMAQSRKPGPVRASAFELVDAAGNKRAELAISRPFGRLHRMGAPSSESGPSLTFWTPDGGVELRMESEEPGSSLYLGYPSGKEAINITAQPHNSYVIVDGEAGSGSLDAEANGGGAMFDLRGPKGTWFDAMAAGGSGASTTMMSGNGDSAGISAGGKLGSGIALSSQGEELDFGSTDYTDSDGKVVTLPFGTMAFFGKPGHRLLWVQHLPK